EPCEAPRRLLPEEFSGGRKEDDGCAGSRLAGRRAQNALDGIEQRLRLQNHALAAAERAIVHGAMAVVGGLAQVVHAHLDETRLAGPADDSMLERAGEEAGENRDDVETERHSQGFLEGESTLKHRGAA